jgi:hypothetical protein
MIGAPRHRVRSGGSHFPQILDGASLDDSKDVLLLVGLGALVLVGVFATELANESWDLVQASLVNCH